MQAYEFLAKPQNGTIAIPNELRHIITSNVKVIVVVTQNKDDSIDTTIRKSDLILPPTLDTRGWKFDREEANER